MRLSSLICISALWTGAAAANPGDLTPLVAQFRLGDQSVDALAWRDEAGAAYASHETLEQFRLRAPAGARVALDSVPGLSYRTDEAEAAIVLSCSAACFAEQTLSARAAQAQPLTLSSAGAFLNMDLSATNASGESNAGGVFDLGMFGPAGFGEINWVYTDAHAVRLESQWTLDLPARRTRVRLGDSITRVSATGLPVRFGGVQLATDFTLQPGFVSYPTPTLHGEASAPSTVDLYVDGALRSRQQVDAGPFSIVDAPVVSGGGVAQIVVRDALGREQSFSAPFYASPSMLRAGLSDYSLALGAERRDFTRVSNSYGSSFASGLYRRGVTDWMTSESWIEASKNFVAGSIGASLAAPAFGQIDLAIAQSDAGKSGTLASAAWTYASDNVSVGLSAQTATRHFTRLGQGGQPAPRIQVSAFASTSWDQLGSASLAYTAEDDRDRGRVLTLALNFTPRAIGDGGLTLSALRVDDGHPFTLIGMIYSVSLHGGAQATATAEMRHNRIRAAFAAQQAADPDGGLGWRTSVAGGAQSRLDGALTHIGKRTVSSAEFSHADGATGLRGSVQTSIALIDGKVMASRPIQDSFALVEVGLPRVGIYRDHRRIGETDSSGRLLLTGLRAYETNEINVALDEMPINLTPISAATIVVPSPRSGVVVRFAPPSGRSGEVRVLDAEGAPLPEGALLRRLSDGARFPIGADGRAYLSGVAETTAYAYGRACALYVAPSQIGGEAQCRAVS